MGMLPAVVFDSGKADGGHEMDQGDHRRKRFSFDLFDNQGHR